MISQWLEEFCLQRCSRKLHGMLAVYWITVTRASMHPWEKTAQALGMSSFAAELGNVNAAGACLTQDHV